MKIGVITDVHNNVVALQAVLQHFEQEQIDGIICCGDIIGIGTYPEETVQAVMKIPNMLACVCGNHDRFMSEGYDVENTSAGEIAHHEWEHSLLSEESKDFIAGLPRSQTLTILGHTIHVTHYGMDENGRYTGLPTFGEISDMREVFKRENSKVNVDVILHGHNHLVYIIHIDRWYINPGSLGCPGSDKNIAKAVILHVNENNISFENVRVAYDVTKTLADMDKFNYPEKDFIKKIFYGV